MIATTANMFRKKPKKIECRFKVVVIGDAGVGKSSLLMSYKDGTFIDAKSMYIHPNRFISKPIRMQDFFVELHLCDVYQQDIFGMHLGSDIYTGAKVALLCVGLNGQGFIHRDAAIRNVRHWKKDLDLYCPYIPHILVCTASDAQPNFSQINCNLCTIVPKEGTMELGFKLPSYLFHYILSYLALRDICNCAQLNSTWYSNMQKDEFWKDLFHIRFKDTKLQPKFPTWQLEYKQELYYANYKYIRRSDVEALAKEYRLQVYFTSAKLGTNVEKLFDDVACMLATRYSEMKESLEKQRGGFMASKFRLSTKKNDN